LLDRISGISLSIRVKVFLVVALATVGVVLPILFSYSQSQQRQLVKIARQDLDATAQTAAYLLAGELNINKLDHAEAHLDWLTRRSELIYVALLDPLGRTILSTNPENHQTLTPNGWETIRREDSALYEICEPIEHEGRKLGYLSVGFSVASLQARLHADRQRASVLGLVAVLVALILAWWLSLLLDRHSAALTAARAEADRANQQKSDFLANMSHEIRTPMTAIVGFANLLLEVEQSPSEKLNCIQTIRRNCDHLLLIINDVLDVSKIEAGKMVLERIACSPAQIVDHVASLMRVKAEEKGLSLDVEYVGKIPKTIRTDPTRLRQILMNLTGNAIKFTETGGVKLVTRMVEAPDAPEPMIGFEIIDSGVGMTPGQLEKLFQPFTQADSSTTRRFGGTGLGLTISGHLAVALGGRITVTSRPGQGSRFLARIRTGSLAGVETFDPATEAGLPDNSANQEAKPSESGVEVRVTGRVLLAEDGLDNQRLISYHLKRAGAAVEVVGNGLAAVEAVMNPAAAEQPFDLVFMDMQMPELDGYGATRRLRRAGYRGPIVALTAHAMAGDRQKCLDAGCDDYATKPIRRDALIELLTRYLTEETECAVAASPAASPPAAAEDQDPVGEATGDLSPADEPIEPLMSEFALDSDFSSLISDYVQGLAGQMAVLETAFLGSDLDAMRRIAHQVKGSAGSYGFPTITGGATALEQHLKDDADRAMVRRHLSELQALCRRAEAGIGLLPPGTEASEVEGAGDSASLGDSASGGN
jgi:signal transduction histidine kinase/CheY-like chemotaxis protein/HPt (histidine-containing phosphotransfer) domain-containing protein